MYVCMHTKLGLFILIFSATQQRDSPVRSEDRWGRAIMSASICLSPKNSGQAPFTCQSFLKDATPKWVQECVWTCLDMFGRQSGLRNVFGHVWTCLDAKVGSEMCLDMFGHVWTPKWGPGDLEKSVWAPERGEKSDANTSSGMWRKGAPEWCKV